MMTLVPQPHYEKLQVIALLHYQLCNQHFYEEYQTELDEV